MAMEDKNTPVQPDAVEATETRGRKVGAARFLSCWGAICGRFIKPVFCACWASPRLCRCFVQHYGRQPAAVPAVRRCRRADCRTCFCGMLDTILRALRDEPGYWWHTYRMAWKQNWRESLLPGAGAGFCLGLWAFCCTPLPDLENVPISVWICMVLGIFFLLVFCLYLFAQVVLVSVSQAERLKNAALFMIGFLPRTLAAGAVLCIYWGVMLAWMPYTIPVVLILGFWLPCTLALQIIYPALDKAFHLEKTITARREDEINDLMEQNGHTSV